VSGGGKGIRAQRALLEGGTLANGKVGVMFKTSHGHCIRELVARVKFHRGEVVTCYGGFLERVPGPETDEHWLTHMRHIPLNDHVLNGLEFSNTFPASNSIVLGKLGYREWLHPRGVGPEWIRIIESSGLGYMANTVTKCPMTRTRPNVIVDELILGRVVEGVPYSAVLVLRAGDQDIQVDQTIVSPYEAWKQNQLFEFKCADEWHYIAAGKDFSSVDV
jgi:hypothetical protein